MPATEYKEKKLQTSTEILSIKHGEIKGDSMEFILGKIELPTFTGTINYLGSMDYTPDREEKCECGRTNEWIEIGDRASFWGCKLCYLKADYKDLINKLIDNIKMQIMAR